MSTQNLFPVDRSILAESAGTALGRFLGLNFTGAFTLRDRGNFLEVEAPATVTPSAPNLSVQYNNGGAFGGSSNFLVDPATGQMSVFRLNAFGEVIELSSVQCAAAGYVRARGSQAAALYAWRNALNTADLTALAVDAASGLYVGTTSTLTNRVDTVIIDAQSAIGLNNAGGQVAQVAASLLRLNDAVVLQFGTTNPATAGDQRVRNLWQLLGRNAANSANIQLIGINGGSNQVLVGGAGGGTLEATDVRLCAATRVISEIAGSPFFAVASDLIESRSAIVGYELFSSPYGAHGNTSHTFAADANYTVLASQYKYDRMEFITGAITAGRTVTWPHPAANRSYCKTIWNNTNQTLTISTGTGTTQTLATTLKQRFEFSSAGVNFASPTY